jgi:alpha-ketoglutarate-dependent taurine dioxygenase
MTLTRSYGKNLVSLVNFNKNDREEKFFKVKAWSTSLVPHEVKDELNQGMSKYYNDHKNSFNKLVSVTFCGRKHLVELVYLEELPRSE